MKDRLPEARQPQEKVISTRALLRDETVDELSQEPYFQLDFDTGGLSEKLAQKETLTGWNAVTITVGPCADPDHIYHSKMEAIRRQKERPALKLTRVL